MGQLKENFLEDIASDLPIIRPIKEFIHLNLLLPYQKLDFWEAIQNVSIKLEAQAIPPMTFYRQKMNENPEYKKQLLEEINNIKNDSKKNLMSSYIFEDTATLLQNDIRIGELHDQWNSYLGIDVMRLADGMLIRWLGMFLDQGIAKWSMPGSDTLSFFQCIKLLLDSSIIKPVPFNGIDINHLFSTTAEETIENHLSYLCPKKGLQERYATESILTLRGWAGLIHSINKEPHLLNSARKITLYDFLAIKLSLERAWIMEENTHKGWPDLKLKKDIENHPLSDNGRLMAIKLCQETLEKLNFNFYLNAIKNNEIKESIKQCEFQAVFCIDDRECSIRRHLEKTNPQVQTFGTAGHFGVECFYQNSKDPYPKKHCPLPVIPKVLLKENVEKHKKTSYSKNILKYFSSFSTTVKLLLKIFYPLNGNGFQNIIHKKKSSISNLIRISDEPIMTNNHQVKQGYSIDEMAKVVYEQLQIIGLIKDFSSLIFIIGHGSTSENNPYFTAYGCGACSGRPGGPNAKIFVTMANLPEVRHELKKNYNFEIPNTTHFVAGMHDTCSDTLTFFETHTLPQEVLSQFETFKQSISIACTKNAEERLKNFPNIKQSSRNPTKDARLRSLSFFETRPEMGHTNALLAIVGNRSLSKNLDLHRRAFMQSYDPAIDPNGDILAKILTAVVPVCSGISLDYFFSNVDNLRFGAGSKLPQNIVGNIGTSHGTESDLLYGLPLQMVDQHNPLRLAIIVEQKPEIALKVISYHPLVQEIIENNWVYYYCYDSQSSTYYQYVDGKMLKTILKE